MGMPRSRLHSTPPQDGMLLTTTATSALTRPSSMAACSARRLLPPPETNTATLALGFASPAARAATHRERAARALFVRVDSASNGRRLETRGRESAVIGAVDILGDDTNRRVAWRRYKRGDAPNGTRRERGGDGTAAPFVLPG